MVSKTLASSEVGHLINQWYGYIRSFSIPDSEYLKKEIENKLDQMEEDQDLLLYYSLMEFRHRLMLESLEPLEKLRIDQQPNLSDLLSEIENNQSRIKGILDYYFNFFKGQFEFSRKNYIQAIQYYKRAELKLDLIPEEEKIEKAEFHYKVAAAYYRIKQNMFSLHHAEIALNMFEANKLYSTSTISCEMMLGANKLDLLRFDEAEAHYTNAMKFAELTKDNYSRGLACHNIGLSYALQNKSDLAEEYFRKVLEIPEYYETERGLRTDFELTFVLYKNGKIEEAQKLLVKGIKKAEKEGEAEYLAKFNIVHALYGGLEAQKRDDLIQRAFKYLEEKQLWTDIEELSQDIAEHFRIIKDYANTVLYLDKVIYAKNKILSVSEELM